MMMNNTDGAILFSTEETNSSMENFTDAEVTSGKAENLTLIPNEEEINLTTALAQRLSTSILNDNIFSRIHLYGLLVVIPLGFFLNSLTLIILCKCKTFASSIGNHLKCIAVSDNIFLLGFFFYSIDDYWEEKINIAHFVKLNDWTCKITMTTLSVGFISTGLILSSATIERFLAVAVPLKYRSWNTRRTSKIILSICFIFSFAASLFSLILRRIDERGRCKRNAKHDHIYEMMFLITQTIIANGICGSLITLFTLLIVGLLFRQARTRNALSNNSSNVNSKQEIKITVMLVIVTSLFIVLRFPKVIVLKLIQQNANPLYLQSLSKFTSLILAVNHATNFFIYLGFLTSFRIMTFEMFSWFFVKILECVNFLRLKRRPSDKTSVG